MCYSQIPTMYVGAMGDWNDTGSAHPLPTLQGGGLTILSDWAVFSEFKSDMSSMFGRLLGSLRGA